MHSANGSHKLIRAIRIAFAGMLSAVALALIGGVFFAQSAPAATTSGDGLAVKQAVITSDCVAAVKNLNAKFRTRAVWRYRYKNGKTVAKRRKYARQVRASDRRVANARARVASACGGGTVSITSGSACFTAITKIDNLINLQYKRKMQLRKVRGNSSKAKKRRSYLRKRLRIIDGQIKLKTTLIFRSCESSNGAGGGAGTPDTTPPGSGPGILISGSGPGGQTNATNPVVEITAPTGETGGKAECKIMGNDYSGEFADFTPVTSPWILPNLPEGSYTIVCRWVDDAGNVGPSSSQPLVIDRTNPVVTIEDNGFRFPKKRAFIITVNEAVSSRQCMIDSIEYHEVDTSYTTPSLTDGSHTLTCRATDLAGNTSLPVVLTFTIEDE